MSSDPDHRASVTDYVSTDPHWDRRNSNQMPSDKPEAKEGVQCTEGEREDKPDITQSPSQLMPDFDKRSAALSQRNQVPFEHVSKTETQTGAHGVHLKYLPSNSRSLI